MQISTTILKSPDLIELAGQAGCNKGPGGLHAGGIELGVGDIDLAISNSNAPAVGVSGGGDDLRQGTGLVGIY